VLHQFLQKIIDPHDTNEGRVIAGIIIPDYSQLFQEESKLAEGITGYKIMRDQSPFLKCLYPKEYLSDNHFKVFEATQNFKIDTCITNQIKSTHTAFVALDSLKSVLKIKKAAE